MAALHDRRGAFGVLAFGGIGRDLLFLAHQTQGAKMEATKTNDLTKRPRHFAAAYVEARTAKQKAAAVQGCPDEWKNQVNTHVRNFKARQKMQMQTHSPQAEMPEVW